MKSLIVILILLLFPLLSVQNVYPESALDEADTVSPARKIQHSIDRQNKTSQNNIINGYRSIDGTGNNLSSPDTGSAFSRLSRLTGNDYADGISAMAGTGRLSAREISNLVSRQEQQTTNELFATDYLWQWGQFLDHDIDLTDGADPAENVNISVPAGDLYFDPDSTGAAFIMFNRSIYDKTTGTDISNPREQLNEITAWIDASNIYGSDQERADLLRENDGTGRTRMINGLLIKNTLGIPNAGGDSEELFISGDVRANEQVGLTSLHILFSREHNRLAGIIAEENPEYTGDEIYQEARKKVGALMQVVTYNEFLPALLGQGRLSEYEGYNQNVNSDIINEFSTAAFRFGHSALSPVLLRLDEKLEVIEFGNLPLREAFFSPGKITGEGGIDPILRGLALQECQKIDPFIIDDVRNFLFGMPGSGGFDLASLNIQRGRDHGLPDYNSVRIELGLTSVQDFNEISSDPEIQDNLRNAYGTVDNIDLWTGGLSEDPLSGSHLGELFTAIIVKQFEALRDGDRFWYQINFSGSELEEIENTKLSDIIRRNTGIGDEIQDDVFLSASIKSTGGCTLSGPSNYIHHSFDLFFLSIFIMLTALRKEILKSIKERLGYKFYNNF